MKPTLPNIDDPVVAAFGEMIIRGLEIQRELIGKAKNEKRWAEQYASVPAWIKAKSTEELALAWANTTDECLEHCDEFWRELIGRGRGDLCPI